MNMTPEQQENALRLLRMLSSYYYLVYNDNYDDVGHCNHCQQRGNEKHLPYCAIGQAKEFLKSFELFT